MHVLHFIATMGGGGAERQLCYLSAGLVERGHKVTVAMQRGGPNLERLRASGATITWIADRSASDPRLYLSLGQCLRRYRPTVVQTWLPRMDVAAGPVARALGVPWVLTERGAPAPEGRRAREAVGRFANAVVANSDTAAAAWVSRGFQRVHTIVNAIPIREIDASPPADLGDLGISPSAPLIVFTGRLNDPEKNVFRLIDALITVLRDRAEVRAVIAGEGPDRKALEAKVDRAGLSGKIIFMGYTPAVFSLLRRASVFVSPSHLEGRPNTVGEAIAARVPVCLSKIAQHTEFVPPDAAVFFEPEQTEAIAAAIRTCLDDPDAARARADRARAIVESFSITSMSAAFEALYQEVIAK